MFEFMENAPTTNAFDLDLLHLTALFTAANGQQFYEQLMNREARNAQFGFLNPKHFWFAFFTRLVEQYTKIIFAESSVANKLTKETEYDLLLRGLQGRARQEMHERKLIEQAKSVKELERMEYQSIDWHDFCIVQSIDFVDL